MAILPALSGIGHEPCPDRALDILRHEAKRLAENVVKRAHVQKVPEVEAHELPGVGTVLMALEKHPVGREMQVGLGARKNLERALLRAALKRDALALEQNDLLLRSRYGLEG